MGYGFRCYDLAFGVWGLGLEVRSPLGHIRLSDARQENAICGQYTGSHGDGVNHEAAQP